MYKGIFTLYLVCFGCYLLFTRQPDYFDGEKAPAAIQMRWDSASGKTLPKAVFQTRGKQYAIDASYPLLHPQAGDSVTVIYEVANPEKAAVYRFWGYWLGWGELIMSVILCAALFQVAVSVTSNPAPEAVIEQLEYKEEKKTRYKT
ncbi:MAG: hypothetical protein GXC72_13560 [Chitinophagaceae bacterium]|nr:hypothetical protein [Chitinophagaceae bacterium]